jgi:hypothetical protein
MSCWPWHRSWRTRSAPVFGNWSEQARWHYELSQNVSTAQGFSYRTKNYRPDELVEPDVWWIAPHACHGWTAPADWSLNKWVKDAAGEWQETSEALFTIREGETIEEAAKRSASDDRPAVRVPWPADRDVP